MDEPSRRHLVQTFFEKEMFGVVSSIWNGMPQSAVVAFTELEDFAIVFGTMNFTRKFRNIELNPNVSMVIGWDEAITIQMEGTAKLLEGDEKSRCQKKHLRKHPGAEQYANMPEQRYLKITPRWIRYTDISEDPEFIFELDLKSN